MSKPSDKELEPLKVCIEARDDERFHSDFDDLLEAKLMELDPEWMKFMSDFYEKSNMERWCA